MTGAIAPTGGLQSDLAFGEPAEARITIVSFGYGHGPAPTATLTADLRLHYRDPHIDPALRHLDANDERVRKTVADTSGTSQLVAALASAVAAYLLGPSPAPITIAVGCVGGRHRAPSVAAALQERLNDYRITASLLHRDLHQPVINHAHT